MLAGRPLSDARDALVARLHDYAGASGQKVIVVFDAWQSERQQRTVEENGWITVVYTQKGETADHYIERVCDNLAEEARAGRLRLRVATSDGLEQTIVLGRGAERVPRGNFCMKWSAKRARWARTAAHRHAPRAR